MTVHDYERLARDLRQAVSVCNRRHRLKVYRNCFLGCDAVRYFLESGTAIDERDAVLLGRRLLREGFFRHVTNEHDFKNEKHFYRFAGDDQDIQPVGKVFAADLDEFEARQIVEEMRFHLSIRDRRRGVKVYKRCFVGKDAVALFLTKVIASNVAEALSVGQALLEGGFFCHVKNERPFENSTQLYRFADDWSLDDDLEMDVMVERAQTEIGVSTIRSMGKFYKGFSGRDLLLWIEDSGFVKDQDEALDVAQYWLDIGILYDPSGENELREDSFFCMTPQVQDVRRQRVSRSSRLMRASTASQTAPVRHSRDVLAQRRLGDFGSGRPSKEEGLSDDMRSDRSYGHRAMPSFSRPMDNMSRIEECSSGNDRRVEPRSWSSNRTALTSRSRRSKKFNGRRVDDFTEDDDDDDDSWIVEINVDLTPAEMKHLRYRGINPVPSLGRSSDDRPLSRRASSNVMYRQRSNSYTRRSGSHRQGSRMMDSQLSSRRNMSRISERIRTSTERRQRNRGLLPKVFGINR
mmetsp:Transcript_8429/g.25324  ORF Transcript_8429/g.25324 Transcript_8429/m.25324 type:complete len:519 (+) Transcript_8429:306-1862(+)